MAGSGEDDVEEVVRRVLRDGHADVICESTSIVS